MVYSDLTEGVSILSVLEYSTLELDEGSNNGSSEGSRKGMDGVWQLLSKKWMRLMTK